MTKDKKQEKGAEEKNNPENSSGGKEEKGNFFSRYGKIFLILAVLLAQSGGAYAIINTYYDRIHDWISSLKTRGGVYHNFENIIINPAESGGERYLILSVAVELQSESQLARLEKNQVRIIDQINQILSQRTADELADLKTRNRIKEEIGLMINQEFEESMVRNLFFTKYVLQ